MTITTFSASPLFVVVGATGAQGRSVIQAIQRSQYPYRVRALTRDMSKLPARRLFASFPGIELRAVEDLSSVSHVRWAFSGADVVFAMTLTVYEDEAISCAKEYKTGVALMDSAKAERVQTVIWSGAVHLGGESGGKTPVDIFDVKADIAVYARSLSAFRFIDVQPGFFASNYLTFLAPRRAKDGMFVLSLVQDSDARVPVLDVQTDYGRYVVAALEDGKIEVVHAAPESITGPEQADAFSKVSGRAIVFEQMHPDVARAIYASHQRKSYADALLALFSTFSTTGYFGGRDLGPSNAILPPGSRARTFEQFLYSNQEVLGCLFI